MWPTQKVIKHQFGRLGLLCLRKTAHKCVHLDVFNITFSNIISSLLSANPREQTLPVKNYLYSHYHTQSNEKLHTTNVKKFKTASLTPTTSSISSTSPLYTTLLSQSYRNPYNHGHIEYQSCNIEEV